MKNWRMKRTIRTEILFLPFHESRRNVSPRARSKAAHDTRNIHISLITIESREGGRAFQSQFPVRGFRRHKTRKYWVWKTRKRKHEGEYVWLWDVWIALEAPGIKKLTQLAKLTCRWRPQTGPWILRAFHSTPAFHPTRIFLIKIKTFGVFTGSVSRLEGNERRNLHVTLSIHEMLKGKSLKWTWKVFLRGFSTEIVN